MTTACAKCRANLWDDEIAAGRRACCRCERTAFDQLRALPALFRRIDQTSALIKGSGIGVIGSPNRDAPAPVKIGVLSLTVNGGVVTQLQAIEDSWRAALAWSMGASRHPSDIDGATTFLSNNVRWACENYDEIADDLKKIGSLHGQLSSIDTGTPPPKRFEVYCDTTDCGGVMRVTINTERATCPDCDTEYGKTEIGFLDSQYGPNPNKHAA
ncbi:hypothetical protein [Streptomyces sp. NPDC059828]|uniref:hypothetical protein n=1 Tax=Streptomyces sp. NPDC059828 TaxID=3346965 RepID=UPI00364C7104